MQDIWPDVIAGLFVAAAFVAGLWIAYRLGFRSALPGRVAGLDFLPSALSLDGTWWSVELMAKDAPSTADQERAVLQFHQFGSRLTADGRHARGTAWQLEGVVNGREILCFVKGFLMGTTHPGILLLRSEADDDHLSGYWIDWQATGTVLSMREVTLMRSESTLPHAGSPSPADA